MRLISRERRSEAEFQAVLHGMELPADPGDVADLGDAWARAQRLRDRVKRERGGV